MAKTSKDDGVRGIANCRLAIARACPIGVYRILKIRASWLSNNRHSAIVNRQS
jgi:hypothetical protein